MPRSKQEAKRKKRGHFQREAPLPIPLNASTSGGGDTGAASDGWFYYTGYIEGGTVLVKHSGDMDFLYKMGFFGKGTLSRSQPNFQERRQKVNLQIPTKEGGTKLQQLPVMNKRIYLAHRRYQALAKGRTSELHEIMYHEEQQHHQGEDSEDEMEDEEDFNDSFDMGMGGGLSATSRPADLRTVKDLSTLPRAQLVALLAQISVLSNQQIASFIRVPQTLADLETRFKNMRNVESEVLKRMYSSRFPSSVLLDGEVIQLDDDEPRPQNFENSKDDAVIVLDSDDDDDDDKKKKKNGDKDKAKTSWLDSEEGDTEFWGSEKEGEKGKDDVSKSKGASTMDWDDNDEGNAEAWGMTAEEQKGKGKSNKTQGVNGEGNKGDGQSQDKSSEESKDKDKSSGNVDSGKDEGLKPLPVCESDSGDKKDGGEKLEIDKEIPSEKNGVNGDGCKRDTEEEKEIPTRDIDQVNGKGDGKKCTKDSLKDGEGDRQEVKQSEQGKVSLDDGESSFASNNENIVSGDDSKENDSFEAGLTFENAHSSEETDDKSNSKQVTDVDANSNDSDDVICIESASAEPGKIRNLLSGSSSKSSTLTNKFVQFMTNSTRDPCYVRASVGFNKWDDLLHFNYTGDPIHLPTAMSVSDKMEGLSSNLGRKEAVPPDATTWVYERIYPPVRSLVPGPNSQGALMKQRVQGLPYLDAAKILIGSKGVSLGGNMQELAVNKISQLDPAQLPKPLRPIDPSTLLKNNARSMGASSTSDLPHISQLVSQTVTLSASLITQYLQAFGCNSSDSNLCDEPTTTTTESSPQLQTVLSALQKLREVGDSKESSRDSEKTRSDSCSDSFHNDLDVYVKGLSISPEQECHLLQRISGEVTYSVLSEVDLATIKQGLSAFQLSLLQERLDKVKTKVKRVDSLTTSGDSGSENRSETVTKISTGGETSAEATLSNVQSERKRKLEDEDDSSQSESKKEKLSLAEESVTAETKHVKSGKATDNVDMEAASDEKPDSDISDVKKPVISVLDVTDTLVGEQNVSSTPEESSVSKEDTSTQSKTHKDGSENENKQVNLETKSGNLEKDSVKSDLVKDRASENKNTTGDESMSEGTSKSGDREKRKEQQDPKSGADKPSVPGSSEDNQICIGSSSSEEEDVDDDDDDDFEEDEENEEEEGELIPGKIYRNFGGLHPFSVEDDDDPDTFVVENSSDEDDDDLSQSRGRNKMGKWRPCLKKDPYPASEKLHLLLEEAFFLSYGLGCLRIFDPEMQPLTLTQMWRQFQVLKEQFLPHYVAYHYFRSKGWVPKSGLKFGCDFILYREGPPFYHGSYSVVVVAVKGDSLQPLSREDGLNFDERKMSWISLSGLNRITEHVAKELMLCYVIWPKDLTPEDSLSPKCISSFKVKEVVVSRWVSSQEREDKLLEEEIP